MVKTAGCPAGGQEEHQGTSGEYSWVIAVAICLTANAIANLGLNFQKLAHEKRKAHPEDKTKYRSLWFVGFLGIVGGAIGDFTALGFGAQSIVAPLGSMSLVANVFFAPCMLGERVSARDLLATASIVAGCALAVVFATHKDCLLDMHHLFMLYLEFRFLVYAATVVGSIAAFLVVIKRAEKAEAEDIEEYNTKWLKLHRFSYATISGIAGAQSVLLAKTTVEMVLDSLRGGGFFLWHWEAWVVLLSMGTSVTLQIYWLNCGLARWDALYNIPVFQSFWIMVSVLGGGVFYDEFVDFDAKQWVFFPAGVLMTIFGVAVLSQRDATEAQRRHSIDVSRDGTLKHGHSDTASLLEGGQSAGGSGQLPRRPKSSSIGEVRVRERRANTDLSMAHQRLHFVTMDPITMSIHVGAMYAPQAYANDEAPTSHPVLDVADMVVDTTTAVVTGRIFGIGRRARASSSTALGVSGEASAGGTFDGARLGRERSSTFN